MATLPLHAGIHPPRQTSPIPQDVGNKQAVRILMECILVENGHIPNHRNIQQQLFHKENLSELTVNLKCFDLILIFLLLNDFELELVFTNLHRSYIGLVQDVKASSISLLRNLQIDSKKPCIESVNSCVQAWCLPDWANLALLVRLETIEILK